MDGRIDHQRFARYILAFGCVGGWVGVEMLKLGDDGSKMGQDVYRTWKNPAP